MSKAATVVFSIITVLLCLCVIACTAMSAFVYLGSKELTAKVDEYMNMDTDVAQENDVRIGSIYTMISKGYRLARTQLWIG